MAHQDRAQPHLRSGDGLGQIPLWNGAQVGEGLHGQFIVSRLADALRVGQAPHRHQAGDEFTDEHFLVFGQESFHLPHQLGLIRLELPAGGTRGPVVCLQLFRGFGRHPPLGQKLVARGLQPRNCPGLFTLQGRLPRGL
jgi:hypothetical protein